MVADIHAHSETYGSGRPVSGPDLTACRDNPIRALEVAGALWETIDRYSSVMADAYRMAQLEPHHQQDTRRGALFEALLERTLTPTVPLRKAVSWRG